MSAPAGRPAENAPGASRMQELGLVGLGKMGSAMLERLLARGIGVAGFDLDGDSLRSAAARGARTLRSLEELAGALKPPRHVWVMVPHGPPTAHTLGALRTLLSAGDLIADGGNSHYRESMREAEECREKGMAFLDVGVSGGVWGLQNGFNLMVGGSPEAFRRMQQALEALAAPGGLAHVGPSGAGHFVKMVHNGLEYGMLEAIGESFECLRRSEFGLDLEQVAALWRNGSVVRSWLLELLERALAEEGPDLKKVEPVIEDSGMGRWTVQYAVEKGIPLPAITEALYQRFASQSDDSFARKVVAALRGQFGGHAVETRAGAGG